jgi:hypothetical protein
MPSLLAEKFPRSNIKISQHIGQATTATLASVDQLLLILPKRPTRKLWSSIPQGNKIQSLLKRRPVGSVPAISTRLNNKRQTALHVGLFDVGKSTFEQLTFCRKMLAALSNEAPGNVAVWALGFDSAEADRAVRSMIAAVLAAAFKGSAPTRSGATCSCAR